MIRRVRLAGAALVLLIASVAAAHAQAPDSSAAKRDVNVSRRGSIGVQAGGSYFVAGGDYADGAQPRLSFAGHFRYYISPKWQWQVSPYFTWSAYAVGTDSVFFDENFPTDTKKDFNLTQVVGASAQLQRAFGKGRIRWHVGAGPALYRVVVQNHRKVLKDPSSKRLHQGTYLGASAEIGREQFLKSMQNTSLEWTLAAQTAFAKRDDQFPRGYNGSPVVLEARFGAHYYFDFKRPKPDAGKKAAPKK